MDETLTVDDAYIFSTRGYTNAFDKKQAVLKLISYDFIESFNQLAIS
jgi:hypothetical protein